MTSQSYPGSGEPTVVFSDPALESRASRRFGPVAVGAALILALATFVIFAGFSPIIPTQGIVLAILAGDGLVTFSLLILIGLELRNLRAARRAARAGARLHNRVVALFSLVAAIPALVTAIVATVSVEWAINPAFMKDVGAFLNESGSLSQLYRESQCRSLLRETELTAGDLAQGARLLHSDPNMFRGYLGSRARALGFTAAAVIKTDGSVLATAPGSDAKLIARPESSDFSAASARQPFCGLLAGGGVFVAMRPIDGLEDSFFYAARAIDPT